VPVIARDALLDRRSLSGTISGARWRAREDKLPHTTVDCDYGRDGLRYLDHAAGDDDAIFSPRVLM